MGNKWKAGGRRRVISSVLCSGMRMGLLWRGERHIKDSHHITIADHDWTPGRAPNVNPKATLKPVRPASESSSLFVPSPTHNPKFPHPFSRVLGKTPCSSHPLPPIPLFIKNKRPVCIPVTSTRLRKPQILQHGAEMCSCFIANLMKSQSARHPPGKGLGKWK